MTGTTIDPCPECQAEVTSWDYVPGTVTMHPCGHAVDMDVIAELRWDWARPVPEAGP